MYFVGVVSHFLVLCRICNQCISTAGGGNADRYLNVTITEYVCFVGVVSRFLNPRSDYNPATALARQGIIIIMYIYHALINALSAHMIHMNLNMLFYTHVEHSPTKTIYIKYYTNKQKNALQTHTHTHTHARTHARTHPRTHAHTHTHTHTHTQTVAETRY